MRKLLRSMARHNLEKAGAVQLNKKQADGKSKFAKFWHDYVFASKPKSVGLNTKGGTAV